MVEYIADYLENIRERRVFPDVKPGYMRDLVPDEAPEYPEPWQNIFNDVERVVMPGVRTWRRSAGCGCGWWDRCWLKGGEGGCGEDLWMMSEWCGLNVNLMKLLLTSFFMEQRLISFIHSFISRITRLFIRFFYLFIYLLFSLIIFFIYLLFSFH